MERFSDPESDFDSVYTVTINDQQGSYFVQQSDYSTMILRTAAAIILCIDSSLLNAKKENLDETQLALGECSAMRGIIDWLIEARLEPKVNVDQHQVRLDKQQVAICFTKIDLMFAARTLSWAEYEAQAKIPPYEYQGWKRPKRSYEYSDDVLFEEDCYDPLLWSSVNSGELVEAARRLRKSLQKLEDVHGLSSRVFLVSAYGKLGNGWNCQPSPEPTSQYRLLNIDEWTPHNTFRPLKWILDEIGKELRDKIR